jgi:hypothetical protein
MWTKVLNFSCENFLPLPVQGQRKCCYFYNNRLIFFNNTKDVAGRIGSYIEPKYIPMICIFKVKVLICFMPFSKLTGIIFLNDINQYVSTTEARYFLCFKS